MSAALAGRTIRSGRVDPPVVNRASGVVLGIAGPDRRPLESGRKIDLSRPYLDAHNGLLAGEIAFRNSSCEDVRGRQCKGSSTARRARPSRVVGLSRPGRNVAAVTDSDSVRASDNEREVVVERLRTASVEGRLSFEELTSRTEAAYSAQTRGELANVTSDLPETRPQSTAVEPARNQRMVSVFADVTRRGWWRAEGTVSPLTVFGDIDLDLRQAAVPSGQVEISAVAPFGDIEVVVPDGVSVELSGFSLFGRKKVDVRRSASNAPVPVVRVRGITVFGSILVRS
jgi:hypothetical protein